MEEVERRNWIAHLEEIKKLLEEYHPNNAVHIYTKEGYSITVVTIDEVGLDFIEVTVNTSFENGEFIESRLIPFSQIEWVSKDKRFFYVTESE